MLVAFRLFLVAAGLVVLALAVTARGLVPEPDVRTRIGEVPSVGRSLVQQAIVPPAMIERQSSGPEGKRAEAPAATSEPWDSAVALAPAGIPAGSRDEPAVGAARGGPRHRESYRDARLRRAERHRPCAAGDGAGACCFFGIPSEFRRNA